MQNNNDELRRKRHEGNRPNHILLFTIINPVYPINVVSLFCLKKKKTFLFSFSKNCGGDVVTIKKMLILSKSQIQNGGIGK